MKYILIISVAFIFIANIVLGVLLIREKQMKAEIELLYVLSKEKLIECREINTLNNKNN